MKAMTIENADGLSIVRITTDEFEHIVVILTGDGVPDGMVGASFIPRNSSQELEIEDGQMMTFQIHQIDPEDCKEYDNDNEEPD